MNSDSSRGGGPVKKKLGRVSAEPGLVGSTGVRGRCSNLPIGTRTLPTYTPLPIAIADFLCSRWEDLQPWFDELMAVAPTPESLPGFLRQMSDLDECVGESITRLSTWPPIARHHGHGQGGGLPGLPQGRGPAPVDRANQALMAKLLECGLTTA